MSTNPFKAFIPYVLPKDDVGVFNRAKIAQLTERKAADPSGGQWRAAGFAEPLKGEGLCIDLQGTAQWVAVQFNERILPGKVRDEYLSKAVAKLEVQMDRKVSKKEYAELRDQTEFDLLPKAFIRRTLVHVFFTRLRGETSQPVVLVCTTSQKRADDIHLLLQSTLKDFTMRRMEVNEDVLGVLKSIAQDEFDDAFANGFTASNFAVLKGAGKKTIRIKDKPLEDDDVQALLTDYEVHELGLRYSADVDDDEPDLTLIVKDGFSFKSLALPDVKTTQHKEDAFGFAHMAVGSYRQMLDAFIRTCGFLKLPEVKDKVADEDDEL